MSIPRLKNAATDLLATSAARLVPTNNRRSIELIFRPGILENITNMRLFYDDPNIFRVSNH